MVCVIAAGCGGRNGSGASGPYTGAQPAFSQTDLVVGTGTRAARTARITVNYTGWVYDPDTPDHKGAQFDTSVGRAPFTFTLGAGEVIDGWDNGFNDMRVGGKRRLIIPANQGYGAQGGGTSIPPNAPLVFEMELLDVK